ncbi:hypothetical protein [Roseimicrobium sp. ORNL1]|uniref:hypothetical protein n=1 Tax=Roseimicrobium sp. ORNL1 TaxID=2711231 RepID=UPI0013E187AF|nr:hypothetical protein [Roseimicrobium sp. ORNL1]QIF05376.1 hypothetical protein G5S37_29010 [Roseimicrobium sp. ORNL1]
MKTLFGTLAALVLLCSPTLARVGETRAEVGARYGDGKKSNDRLKADGVETWKYNKNGFDIEVVFAGDKSVWEIIHRQDKKITDEDIESLLKLYDTSAATNWRFDKKDNRWERASKPKLIAYRWPKHPDFFCIKDIEACEKLEKGKKADASGL